MSIANEKIGLNKTVSVEFLQTEMYFAIFRASRFVNENYDDRTTEILRKLN